MSASTPPSLGSRLPFLALVLGLLALEGLGLGVRALAGSVPLGSAIAFGSSALATAIAPRLSLALLAAALPWLDAALGGGDAVVDGRVSLDVAVGFVVGGAFALRRLERGRPPRHWPSGTVALLVSLVAVLVLGAGVAVARNLDASDAPFAPRGLLLNLGFLRELAYHADYFPLGTAALRVTAIAVAVVAARIVRDGRELARLVVAPMLGGVAVVLVHGIGVRFGGEPGELWRGVRGLMPDIHAFATLALLALGAGLVREDHDPRALRALGVALAAVALAVSGSRSAALIGAGAVGVALGVAHPAGRGRRAAVALLAGLLFLGGAELLQTRVSGIARVLDDAREPSWNERLSYRPEVSAAALRMSALRPVLGIGLGTFRRASSVYEVSGSEFLARVQPGENAHNYFLQTLAEGGVVGALLTWWPVALALTRLRRPPNRRARAALGGLLLANLFGHALLLPAVQILAALLVAGIYATATDAARGGTGESPSVRRAAAVGVVLLAALGLREVARPFVAAPPGSPFGCVDGPIDADGWTSGHAELSVPALRDRRALSLEVAAPWQPALGRPVGLRATLVDGERPPATVETELPDAEPVLLSWILEPGIARRPLRIELTVDACVVPFDLGVALDRRRLGVRLLGVEQLPRPLFADGFEAGATERWSEVQGGAGTP